MKLRIALVAAGPALIGGHSVQAQALSARLIAAGHDVSYIPIDPLPQWLRGIRYVRTILNELLYVFTLLRMVRADVVHVFSASYWSFLLGPAPAILAARCLRKAVILHYHSGEADDHLRRWRKSVSFFFRLVDEIVVPSQYLQDIFHLHGFESRVIPNCIDTSRFQYRERPVPRPRLLSVRNLERHYRVDTAVTAFARVKERFADATLTIVGQGSEESTLRELAGGLHVDGIRFAGAVDPSEMPRTYDAADIFVNASVIDNQPVSILEAFASGLPVVSTPTGDIASMLRGGEAGMIVDADASAMADAVTRLLDEPELSVRVARRAHEEAQRYTWSAIGSQWNALYAEVVNG